MATATPMNLKPAPPGSTPSATDLLDESYAVSGIGIALVPFLGAIPGFLPGILLAVLLGAVVLIPILVVSAAIGAVVGLLLLMARIVSRGVSVVTGARVERDRPQPAPRRAALRISRQAEHQVARGGSC